MQILWGKEIGTGRVSWSINKEGTGFRERSVETPMAGQGELEFRQQDSSKPLGMLQPSQHPVVLMTTVSSLGSS